MDDKEQFESFLTRKILSDETKKLYLTFHNRMLELLNQTNMELSQGIIDSYLEVYPHIVARAYLKNYLEFLKRKDLEITKITGRPEKKEQITLTEQELKLIREELYNVNEKYGLMFDLTNNSALRRKEVLNIKAGDIKILDNEKMFIKIKGKGKKERTVFVPNDVAILVLEYIFNKDLNNEDYLFESPINTGFPISKRFWNEVFSRASYKTTGKRFHPHQLRGTRATSWYDKGVDVPSIQIRLGHRDISTTMLYIKPNERKELEKWSNEN